MLDNHPWTWSSDRGGRHVMVFLPHCFRVQEKTSPKSRQLPSSPTRKGGACQPVPRARFLKLAPSTGWPLVRDGWVSNGGWGHRNVRRSVEAAPHQPWNQTQSLFYPACSTLRHTHRTPDQLLRSLGPRCIFSSPTPTACPHPQLHCNFFLSLQANEFPCALLSLPRPE